MTFNLTSQVTQGHNLIKCFKFLNFVICDILLVFYGNTRGPWALMCTWLKMGVNTRFMCNSMQHGCKHFTLIISSRVTGPFSNKHKCTIIFKFSHSNVFSHTLPLSVSTNFGDCIACWRKGHLKLLTPYNVI